MKQFAILSMVCGVAFGCESDSIYPPEQRERIAELRAGLSGDLVVGDNQSSDDVIEMIGGRLELIEEALTIIVPRMQQLKVENIELKALNTELAKQNDELKEQNFELIRALQQRHNEPNIFHATFKRGSMQEEDIVLVVDSDKQDQVRPSACDRQCGDDAVLDSHDKLRCDGFDIEVKFNKLRL